jgi:hypothetical protein
MAAVRRALPLWLVLVAAYALTLPFDAGHASTLAPAEAHRLLLAESLVSDHDVDLRDEYAARAWRGWYPHRLRPAAGITEGRRVEPTGLGFALLIAPAYALAGPTGARLLLAGCAALAFCLAAALGRALVPEPWPTRAALATGLSPPALAAATAVSPEMVGAAALTGAALLALRVRERPRMLWASGAAALLAALPWLAAKLIVPGAVVAVALWRWLRRRQRGLTGLAALEIVLTSGVLYVVINERLYRSLTPHGVARHGATGLHAVGDLVDRLPRLAGVWLDPHHGVLLWAPVLALAAIGLARLWRAQRERLSVAVADHVDVEVAATLLALIAAAVALTAIVLAPSLGGAGHPAAHGRQLVPALPALAALAAWGLQGAPRVGAALAAVTLGASVGLLALA